MTGVREPIVSSSVAKTTVRSADRNAGSEDILQPLKVWPAHSATASARTVFATWDFRLLAGTMSTVVPSRRSASPRIRPSANNPTLASTSTSRSTSLSESSWPRETLPNKRMLDASNLSSAGC